MESPGSKSGSLGSQKTELAKALWKEKAKLMSGVGASSRIRNLCSFHEIRRVIQTTCH